MESKLRDEPARACLRQRSRACYVRLYLSAVDRVVENEDPIIGTFFNLLSILYRSHFNVERNSVSDITYELFIHIYIYDK